LYVRNFLSWSKKLGSFFLLPFCFVLSAHHKGFSFPPGVLNTVPSLGHVGGAALAAHLDVDKVAFTGSTATGRKIMEAAAKSNLKKVFLGLRLYPVPDARDVTGFPRAGW